MKQIYIFKTKCLIRISYPYQQDSGWCFHTCMQCVLTSESFPAHTDHWSPFRFIFLVPTYKGKTCGICLWIPSSFHWTKCPLIPLSLAPRTGFHFFPCGWLILQYTFIEYILYSSVVGMSHILAPVSGATANTGVQGSLFQADCICFGYLPRSGTVGLYNGSMFSKPHTILHISLWMD